MIIGCRLALFSQGVDGQVDEDGKTASGSEVMIGTGVAPLGVVTTTEISGGKTICLQLQKKIPSYFKATFFLSEIFLSHSFFKLIFLIKIEF